MLQKYFIIFMAIVVGLILFSTVAKGFFRRFTGKR